MLDTLCPPLDTAAVSSSTFPYHFPLQLILKGSLGVCFYIHRVYNHLFFFFFWVTSDTCLTSVLPSIQQLGRLYFWPSSLHHCSVLDILFSCVRLWSKITSLSMSQYPLCTYYSLLQFNVAKYCQKSRLTTGDTFNSCYFCLSIQVCSKACFPQHYEEVRERMREWVFPTFFFFFFKIISQVLLLYIS